MSEFTKEYKEEMSKIGEQAKSILDRLNIKDQDLSLAKCVEIIGEIHKLIRSNVSLVNALDKEDDAKKTGLILDITLHILSLDQVKQVFNEKQLQTILDFCDKKENMHVILKLVNWVANSVLEKLDIDGDGKVTKKEFEENCVKCCKCCPSLGKKVGGCWAWLCINVCCCNCGDDNVTYKK